MDKKLEARYEKPLIDYNYDELINLHTAIFNLPSFIMSDETKISWYDKIKKLQLEILDQAEKDHSLYNRKEKVKKYIQYKNYKNHSEDYWVDEKTDEVIDKWDRSGWHYNIESFYLQNQKEIEEYIDKLIRIAPLTKEQLEQLVIDDEKIYFN